MEELLRLVSFGSIMGFVIGSIFLLRNDENDKG